MFDRGVPTCFASPVLRFAMSNEVSDYAVSLEEIWHLAEDLSSAPYHSDDQQILLDLPYRYTWELLKSGRIPVSEIQEDAHEALYWQFSGSHVYFKLNPFPFSYWRAMRITHDGTAVLNMDLAAHSAYNHSAPHFLSINQRTFQQMKAEAKGHLSQFLAQQMLQNSATPVYERSLARQFDDHREHNVRAV